MIEALLPTCAVAVEAFADVPGEAPYPGEENLVERAVEGHRREFITARRCARSALAALGSPEPGGPIRPGPRREPLWPAGVVGSITHCAGYRAAAVAQRHSLASIGIDAEPHDRLPEGVHDAVTLDLERAHLHRLANKNSWVHWDRFLLSAKESVYKAWYPLTGRWLGFDEDRHQLHTGHGPAVMATLRNTAISLHRLAGAVSIAAALRHHSRDPLQPLQLITQP